MIYENDIIILDKYTNKLGDEDHTKHKTYKSKDKERIFKIIYYQILYYRE